MSRCKRYFCQTWSLAFMTLLCLGLFAPLAQGQQDLVYNGSFELETMPDYPGYYGGPPIGWAEYGGSHVINEHVEATSPFHWGSGPIPHGAQVYGCQGPGAIGQIIGGLTGGTACSLSFYHNLRIGNPGMNLTIQMGNHTVWGPTLITHQSTYTQQTVNFTYQAAWGNELKFIFENPGGDNTILLDHIQLMAVPVYRTVTASVSGGHGSISPSGATPVLYDGRPLFVLTPDPGYRVATIRVNGVLQQEMALNYYMPNVTEDSTLEVTFGPHDWTFDVDGYLDGWMPKGDIAPGSTTAGGVWIYDITQDAGDPIWYSQPLSLSPADYRWMRIIAKNGTSSHSANVFWYGDAMTTFIGGYSRSFETFQNDGEFTEYWLDLHSKETWTDLTTVHQFRLDFPDQSLYPLSEHGTRIEIDRITLLPPDQGPPAPAFTSIKRHTPTSDAYTKAEGVIWEMRFNQPFTPDVSDIDAVTTGTVVAGAYYGLIPMDSLSIGLGYYVSGEGTIKMVGTGTGSGTSNLTGLSMETPFNDGEVFYIDTVGPTVAIAAPSAALTAGGPVSFPVTYSDGGSGVDAVTLTANDVTLTSTDTAAGTVSVSGSGANWTVTLSNITGDGTLAISIAEETAVDKLGNPASASEVSDSFEVDNTDPVITVSGDSSMNWVCGDDYVDAGATASDSRDGDLTGQIQVSGTVNDRDPKSYTITYTVSDAAGNTTAASRTVTVEDNLAPVISLEGEAAPNVALGSTYVDAGATATDYCDGDITAEIVTTGSVDTAVLGTYDMRYSVTDTAGNAADEVVRTVTVFDATQPNVASVVVVDGLTVNVVFSKDMTGAAGLLDTATYTLSGTGQGTLSTNPAAVSAVDGTTVQLSWPTTQEMFNGGAIRITVDEDLKDYYGAPIQTRSAESSTGGIGVAPVITMNAADETLDCGIDSFQNPTASALDDVSGSVAVTVTGDDAVDTAVPGSYTITYTASDAAGNTATASRVVTVADLSGPVISLEGAGSVEVECGDDYVELGATANDACEGDVSDNVVIGGDTVNTALPGTYEVTYDAVDSGDRAAVQLIRTVTVVDGVAPVLSLVGDASLEVECASVYVEPGATALDACEGDLSDAVEIGGDAVDTSVVGESFVITYNVMDSEGNAAAQLTRTVSIVDKTAPAISVLGANPLVLDFGDAYTELGATALDSCEGDLSDAIVVDASAVNNLVLGDYVVTYTVADGSGNEAVAERLVTVSREECQLRYIITITPNPVVPGESLTFRATPEDDSCSVGEVTIQWLKRSKDKADWIVVGEGPVFVIESVDFDDAGDYRCNLSDDMVVEESVVVNIVVGTGMPVTGLAGLAVVIALAAAGGVALRKRD